MSLEREFDEDFANYSKVQALRLKQADELKPKLNAALEPHGCEIRTAMGHPVRTELLVFSFGGKFVSGRLSLSVHEVTDKPEEEVDAYIASRVRDALKLCHQVA